MEFTPERSLYLNEAVSAQSSLEIITGISKLYSADPKKVITLFIASGGGSVIDSFALYDYIMCALKPKLQTVALGEVNSSAVMLFLMGELRYIGDLALIRLHRFSLVIANSLVSKNALRASGDLDRSESKYIDILMKRTNGKITRKTANALLDDKVVITPNQAVKLGLAHKIL